MKRIIILTLISFVTFPILAQFQTPQWEMPIYFEDALGEKDTIYIGYDPKASFSKNKVDSLFDEDFKSIVDTVFNAFLQKNDSEQVRKREIINVNTLLPRMAIDISFTKGKFPLVVSWKKEMLSDTNIPFPKSASPSLGKILITNSFGLAIVQNGLICGFHGSYVATNDPNYFVTSPSECKLLGDSLILTTNDNKKYLAENAIAKIDFAIYPIDYYTSIDEYDREEIYLYPNPFHHFLYLKISNQADINVQLYDSKFQQVVNTNSVVINSEIRIDLSELKSGIYFVHVNDGYHSETFKVQKL